MSAANEARNNSWRIKIAAVVENKMKNMSVVGWVSGLVTLFLATTGCIIEQADGGGASGGGSSSTGEGGAGGDGPDSGTQLFVLSRNLGIASFASAETASGRVEAKTLLNAGPDTGMYGPRDLEIDNQNTLYVASENDGAIVMYASADDATGVVAPSRRLAGELTGIVSPVALALDRDKDVLYVVNSGSLGSVDTDILVFEGASELHGDVAPSRVIEPEVPGFSPLALEFRNNTLYAITQTTNASAIAVFEGAHEALGAVAPTLTIEPFGPAAALHVDADGRVVVVDEGASAFVFDAGETEARAVLEVEGASRLSGVHALSNGTYLFTDGSLNLVFALDDGVPETSGSIAPTRSFDAVEILLPGPLTSP